VTIIVTVYRSFAAFVTERAAARQLYYFTYDHLLALMKKIASARHCKGGIARKRLQGTLACRSTY
jgi:hypothetical protein